MVDYNKITNMLLGLDPDIKKEVITTINEYIKLPKEEKEKYFLEIVKEANAYEDYFEITRLTKKIDSYFNEEIEYYEVEEELSNLKNLKFIYGNNLIKEVYDTFKDKLYNFVLLGMFTSNFDIDKNKTTKDIFYSRLEKKIEDVKNSIIPLPLLVKEIDRVEHSNKDRYKYIDKKLLDKLFYYETDKERFKDESEYAKWYMQKKKEEVRYAEAKKELKDVRPYEIRNRIKLCLYYGTLGAGIVIPFLIGICKFNSFNYASLQHYDTETTYEDNGVELGTYDEYSKVAKNQTYLKEYTKINDDICSVKTYDCAGLDVDSLFDASIDESSLINVEFVRTDKDMFTDSDIFKAIYRMKYNSTEKTEFQKSLDRKANVTFYVMVFFFGIVLLDFLTMGMIDDTASALLGFEKWHDERYVEKKKKLMNVKSMLADIDDLLKLIDSGNAFPSFNEKMVEVKTTIEEELNELKKQKKIQI